MSTSLVGLKLNYALVSECYLTEEAETVLECYLTDEAAMILDWYLTDEALVTHVTVALSCDTATFTMST